MKRFYLFRAAILTAILSSLILNAFAQTSAFIYTGSLQSYTVPAGVTKIALSAFGAQGGNQTSAPAFGGGGAWLYGEFAVTPGHVLSILAGEQPPEANNTGGGGGGTFVWDVTAGNILLIAAGGGGGAGLNASSNDGIDASITNDGTNGAGGVTFGGGGTGGNGGTGLSGTCFGTYAAGGAGWLTNGAGGNGDGCSNSVGGTAPLSGGAGGSYGGSFADNGRGGFGGGGGSQGQCSYTGGGGGGGYSGGGGGNYECTGDIAQAGGGGGSYNGGTNQDNHPTNRNTGHGVVVICEFPAVGNIYGFSSVCIGGSTTLTDVGGVTGGNWVSSNTAIATVGSSSGVVSGVALGTATITYFTPTNSCGANYITRVVTVNPLPIISGGSNVAICSGFTTMLAGTGGTHYSWSPATGLSCTACDNPVASPSVTTTYTVTGNNATSIVYNQSFIGGSIPTTQCTAWDAFRATLSGTYNYIGFTIKGSMNTTGISCTDPVVASAVAHAMRTGTAYTGTSDGQTWTVGIGCTSGPCGTVAVELSNIGACTCASGYSVRPSINNSNWGGIDGNTCGAVSQTLEVDFLVAGCTNTATVTVSVNPLPAVYNVTGGGSYCAGGAGVHIGLDSSNNGIRYQLYNGLSTSGSPLNGRNAPIDFGLKTAGGTYTIAGTDTTTLCASMMAGSQTVVIIPAVVPTVNISINTPDTICAGTTTTFTATGTNGGDTPIYIWKVNGTTAGSDSVAYAYNPADSNVVTVTYISNHVCAIPDTVAATFRMRVFPNGTPAVHIVSSPSDTVCLGTPVTLTSGTTFAGNGPTYSWIKNTVIVGAASSYSYTPADSDNIYCIVISDYLCRLATFAFSDAIYMTVENPIVPSVTITGHPGVYLGTGRPDTLIATVTNGGTNPSFQWYYNGAPVAGTTSSVWTRSSFTEGDSVSCKVTRTDACGLGTINSVVIHIGVGVNTISLSDGLNVIPNPNKGSFMLRGSIGTLVDESTSIEITNMLGQVVYTNQIVASGGNINEPIVLGSELANGIYILNVHSENGTRIFRFVLDK